MKSNKFIRICTLAILLSLALSGPSILIYINSEGNSPRLFSDWDEPYYFPLALQAGNTSSLPGLFQFNGGTLQTYKDLDSLVPHAAADLVIGTFVNYLTIPPAVLGILLDLACFPISFILLVLAFQQFSAGLLVSVISALTILLCPWLFAFSAFPFLAPDISSNIFTLAHNFFPSRPILRGIYTQISYPLFSLILLILIKQSKNQWGSFYSTILLGSLNGLLIYLYFFCWCAITSLFSFLIFIDWLVISKISFRRFLLHLTVGGIFSTIIALPGINLLFAGSKLFSPGAHHPSVAPLPYSFYWFISPIEIVISFALLLFIIHNRFKKEVPSIVLSLCLACILSEHFLMNTQALLNRWVTPYHFPLFYLHPLMSGCIIFVVLHYLKTFNTHAIILGILLCVGVGDGWISYFKESSNSTEEIELFKNLNSQKNISRIASMPFSNAFRNIRGLGYYLLPEWINTLTHQRSFSLFRNYSSDRDSIVKKELFLGLMYSGIPQMIAWCPSSVEDISKKDILIGAEAFLEHQRLIDCTIAKQYMQSINPCELFLSFPVDLILLNPTDQSQVPIWMNESTSLEWRSSKGTYELRKILFDKARAKFCTMRGNI